MWTKEKFFLTVIIAVLWSGSIFSQNPILPPGVYIADPTARVWKDGKIYVYGSRDESPAYYCSWRYDILASDDMKKWKLYPDRFFSKGENDAVPYSDDLLYAPDCWYKAGKYYLYYCLANSTLTEGVAISDSPTGPFINGTNIEVGKYHEIDPSVFVDDDGQGYYVWGQFNLKIARLQSNMKEIDLSSVKENVLTEKEHFFHEGGFLNDHCDPGNWNNHGSLVEYKGKWYVFYHRSTHGCKSMRKACIEPVYFNEDGSINEVEMTSQGAGEPLNSLDEIEAERACLLYGNVRIQAFSPTEEELGKIWNGDCAGYKYLDFQKGITRIKMRIAPGANPGKIDIVIDNSWGPSIGTIDVPGGGNLKDWQTFTCNLLPVNGIRALWLRFRGEGDDLFHIDSFQFEK